MGGERDHHCTFQDGERDSVQVRLLIIDDTLTIPATATNTGCRKLSITRAKIDLRFPSYNYIIYCNFTFDNSNHVCQDVRTKKKISTLVQNIQTISPKRQSYELRSSSPTLLALKPVKFAVTSRLLLLLCFLLFPIMFYTYYDFNSNLET